MKWIILILFVSVSNCFCSNIINQIVIINSTDFITCQLKPQKAQYQYIGLAENGQVYQTSWVFSHYNYEPAKGVVIGLNEYLSDTKSRFVYKPSRYNPGSQLDLLIWSNRDTTSILKVHVLPASKQIISSNFLFGDESWTITDSNPLKPVPIKHWVHNGGFITGTENYINVQSAIGPDKSLWYFKAPIRYYRDLSIGYAGTLEFELIWFAGDLASLHKGQVPLVKLSCPGLTINHYSSHKWTQSDKIKSTWTIQLVPEEFSPQVTKKEFARLLEQINSIEILGDWTSGYETMGLSWVRIKIR